MVKLHHLNSAVVRYQHQISLQILIYTMLLQVTPWVSQASILEDCGRILEAAAQLCPRSSQTAVALVAAVEAQSLGLMKQQLNQQPMTSVPQAVPVQGDDTKTLSTTGSTASSSTTSGATLVKLLQGMSDAGHTPSAEWGSMWSRSLTPAALSDMPDATVATMVKLLSSGAAAVASRGNGEAGSSDVEQLTATVPDAR
jgi:hypothetical protein